LEKLRIIHVVETLAVEGGGGDRACAELAEAQAQNGHDVRVICTIRSDRPTPLRIEGVTIVGIDARGKLARKLGWSPDLFRYLRRALLEADIVHSHGTWRLIQVYVRRACRAHQIPYVLQPHGSFASVSLLHRKWFKRIWGIVFERANLRHAAALHAETATDLSDINAYYRHPNTYILPCGSRQQTGTLDPSQFVARYPQLAAQPYVLYLGRLDFQKGIDLLIDAFDRFSARRPGLNLAIVGPDHNNTKTKLERQVREQGLRNVVFLPQVDGVDKNTLYANALCFVLPSHSENFGITVLEALLADCPVLVSRNTGWATLESDGGGLVFDPTQEDLAYALDRFGALDKEERARMVRRGHDIASGYDWRTIARRQDDVYAEISRSAS
jgi:glycosyltransferase involved in cell wall biosynthesis